MTASTIERAAYIAAHQILTTNLAAPELACPGARRSAITDNMATIIKGVYETELTKEPIKDLTTNARHQQSQSQQLAYTGI